jgi:DegV family protein with EDD domain
MSVVIVTDSSSDITSEEARRLGVDVVPIWLLFGDRRLRDGVDIDKATFFKRMAEVEELPKTEPPSSAEFGEVFGRLVASGHDVVALILAATLSQTFENARLAAAAFAGKVRVVDSKAGSVLLKQAVVRASELVREGKSADEVAAGVDRAKLAGQAYFAMPDIRFLGRSGRLPKPIVALGSLLNVNLVLRMGDDGSVGMAAQSFNFEKSQELMIDAIIRNVGSRSGVRIAVAHCNAPGTARTLAQRIRERAPDLGEPMIHEVGPTIAVHLGAGAVGVSAIIV